MTVKIYVYYAILSGLYIGPDYPVRIMGVLNVSPESFYRGSIVSNIDEAIEKVDKMVEAGVDIIDVGGMSTAPYKDTYIDIDTEIRRVKPIIRELASVFNKPISIDTYRSRVAEEAIKVGASIINDVTGFKSDPNIAKVAGEYKVGAILVAYGEVYSDQDPISNVRRLLKESINIALKNGVDKINIVIDPGIGFFRDTYLPWYEWDSYILRNLYRLTILKRPILIGVSRKSFIGEILNIKDPEHRLYGSLASEAIAVYNGADMIRTHNVRESRDAVKMAEYIRGRRFKKVSQYNVEIIDITSLYTNTDLTELMMDIDVTKEGAEIMSRKGIYKILYIRNIPKVLSIIVKEEMLSAGGDAATPKNTIFSGFDPVDIIIIGNVSTINKLINKLNMMNLKSLRDKGLIGPKELASLIEDIINMD